MTVLAVHVGAEGVTALGLSADGPALEVTGRAHAPVERHSPAAGLAELQPEEVWQATLVAVRGALEQLAGTGRGPVEAIGLGTRPDTVLLWDRETLGSPRAAIMGVDRRTTDVCARLADDGRAARVADLTGLPLDPAAPATKLAWIAEHEPHTWALVGSGRYAVGTLDAYLVARMTRGTWEVTDPSGAARTLLLDRARGDWSEELCEAFGVPLEALPEIVPSWGAVGTSDPRLLAGLELPITGLASDRSAALMGEACLEAGGIACLLGPDGFVIGNAGPSSASAAGPATPAWRSPDGSTTFAAQRDLSGPLAAGALVPAVRDVVHQLPTATRLVLGGVGPDDELCRALADAVGLPVSRSAWPDAPAVGTGVLAGLGSGAWAPDQLPALLPARPGWHPAGG